jgi:hypothetical protein
MAVVGIYMFATVKEGSLETTALLLFCKTGILIACFG